MAANKKKATARHTEDTPVKSFLDMIAPSVVQFNPDHFICGNTFRCVWALREYPTQTDEQALLRHLGEKDGITLRSSHLPRRIVSSTMPRTRTV